MRWQSSVSNEFRQFRLHRDEFHDRSVRRCSGTKTVDTVSTVDSRGLKKPRDTLPTGVRTISSLRGCSVSKLLKGRLKKEEPARPAHVGSRLIGVASEPISERQRSKFAKRKTQSSSNPGSVWLVRR